jgi:hypothetical protein
MRGSLRALLEGILDYAGLFPPAALDMPDAVESYARYREGRYAWMLSHFICPAARFDAFSRAAAPYLEHAEPAWTLSILARNTESAAEAADALKRDLVAAEALEERFHGRLLARALEIRLPAAAAADDRPDAPVAAFLSEVGAALGGHLPRLDQVFVELGFGEARESRLPRAFSAIAAARARLSPRTVGVKIRTGGVAAEAFPSSEEVARFIALARDTGLPFKATAGLHHPVRHLSDSVGARMHGFLNVFAGAALLFSGALAAEDLVRVLQEEDPEAFRFAEDGFAWRGRSCSAGEAARARRNFALAFGSCSFTEPLEDLETLGLL